MNQSKFIIPLVLTISVSNAFCATLPSDCEEQVRVVAATGAKGFHGNGWVKYFQDKLTQAELNAVKIDADIQLIPGIPSEDEVHNNDKYIAKVSVPKRRGDYKVTLSVRPSRGGCFVKEM